MTSQNTAQTMPSRPVTTNEVSQLKVPISQATSGNESAAPMREPLSKMLEARPRSLFGNHFEATLAIEGYAPASPTPSSSRQPNSEVKPRAKEVSAVNTDHHTTATASEMRAHTRSANQPNGSCMTAYVQKNPLRMNPIVAASKPSSRCMIGAATARLARSM